jgi:hypothetical protein
MRNFIATSSIMIKLVHLTNYAFFRNFCMFKHGKKNEEPEPDPIIDAVENISASAVDDEVVVIDREELLMLTQLSITLRNLKMNLMKN